MIYKDVRDAFFDKLYEFGAKDKNVIIITNDMDAFSLRKFKKEYPRQFVNIGVAEQNMVNVAAGLASCGKNVYIYGIASFLTFRCYEQLKFNIDSMYLPVTIVGMGAGLSFSFDGPTHHAMQDVAVMRALPQMKILNPCDSLSAEESANASYESKCFPVYVRLDKGTYEPIYTSREDFYKGYKVVHDLRDINIISTGYATHVAKSAVASLSDLSVDVGLVDIVRLNPLNKTIIAETLRRSKIVIVCEEHSPIGGLKDIVAGLVVETQKTPIMKAMTLRNKQVLKYGSREYLHKVNDFTPDHLVEIVLQDQGVANVTR